MPENLVKRDFTIWNKVGFNTGSMSELMDKLLTLPTQPYSAYVCLVGVPALVAAQDNSSLADVFSNATLTVADGMPIVRRAQKLGLQCDRFSGPDFMYPFFDICLPKEKRHFFYGCTDEVLVSLKSNLKKDYPGIQICGTYAPPYRELTPEEDEDIVRLIQNANPDFLWVGLGGEKQERWMAAHYKRISGCVMLGVGAGFNYIAGTLTEMPDWMEKRSLGWLFRLIQEPKRLWRRYIISGLKYIFYNVVFSFRNNTKDRVV